MLGQKGRIAVNSVFQSDTVNLIPGFKWLWRTSSCGIAGRIFAKINTLASSQPHLGPLQQVSVGEKWRRTTASPVGHNFSYPYKSFRIHLSHTCDSGTFLFYDVLWGGRTNHTPVFSLRHCCSSLWPSQNLQYPYGSIPAQVHVSKALAFPRISLLWTEMSEVFPGISCSLSSILGVG